jgi:hypothetical protein
MKQLLERGFTATVTAGAKAAVTGVQVAAAGAKAAAAVGAKAVTAGAHAADAVGRATAAAVQKVQEARDEARKREVEHSAARALRETEQTVSLLELFVEVLSGENGCVPAKLLLCVRVGLRTCVLALSSVTSLHDSPLIATPIMPQHLVSSGGQSEG